MCMIKQDIKDKPLGGRRHPSRHSGHPQRREIENETKLWQDKLNTTKKGKSDGKKKRLCVAKTKKNDKLMCSSGAGCMSERM